MSLSVEHIDISGDRAVESLAWEVGIGTIFDDLGHCWGSEHLLFRKGIYEVILLFQESVISSDHNLSIRHEANNDQRLIKTRDWDRVLIKVENILQIDMVDIISLSVIERDEELSIVLISKTENRTFIVLLDVVHSEIGSGKLLAPYLFLFVKVIGPQLESVILLGHNGHSEL